MKKNEVPGIHQLPGMRNCMQSLVVAVFTSLFVMSCEKQQDKGPDVLNVSGFRSGNTSEIVNFKLRSGKSTSSPVECYLLGSTLFDPSSGGYGYVDCHGMFFLMDPVSGDTLKAIPVPEYLSQTVVDSVNNMLIGQRSEAGFNYVYKINLQSGETEARNPVDLTPGILACTYFYNSQANEYVLMRSDSMLIFINPDNGEVVDSAKAATAPSNAIYYSARNQLIGVTYDATLDENFLVTLNAVTGQFVNQVRIQERNDYYACMSGFDPETNCYILLNSENKMMFIDIETGKITDSYKIGFQMQEYKFWRGE